MQLAEGFKRKCLPLPVQKLKLFLKENGFGFYNHRLSTCSKTLSFSGKKRMIQALKFISPARLTKPETILYFLISGFFVTLFFAKLTSFNVGFTAALVLYSFRFSAMQEKSEAFKNRKHVWFMLLFFAFLLISFLFSENKTTGLHHLKIRLPLLLFPVSLGLLNITKELKNKVLLTFAGLTTLIGALCLAYSIYLYTQTGRADIFYNDNLTLILKQQSI